MSSPVNRPVGGDSCDHPRPLSRSGSSARQQLPATAIRWVPRADVPITLDVSAAAMATPPSTAHHIRVWSEGVRAMDRRFGLAPLRRLGRSPVWRPRHDVIVELCDNHDVPNLLGC